MNGGRVWNVNCGRLCCHSLVMACVCVRWLFDGGVVGHMYGAGDV